MKCGREMKNMQNMTLAFVPLKFAIGVKQSKCSMHAVVITNKDHIEFSRVQYLQCPNGFDKYVVTDITVKLNSSAIKPILIKPKILMSGSSLCYPVLCLDDRNFSSLFGTITPTQALETWDKASWLKEKVPYKLWQIWHARWLVYDRETKAQFSDYPKMYFVITPGLAQCFSIFKKETNKWETCFDKYFF